MVVPPEFIILAVSLFATIVSPSPLTSAKSAVLFAPPNNLAVNESWNGSSWTEVGDLNTGRRIAACSASGTNTDTIVFGGYTTANIANTEQWNGSSWTETTDLSTARYGGGGHGNTSLAMYSTGESPGGNTAATEEWTAADFEIKSVTTS